MDITGHLESKWEKPRSEFKGECHYYSSAQTVLYFMHTGAGYLWATALDTTFVLRRELPAHARLHSNTARYAHSEYGDDIT